MYYQYWAKTNFQEKNAPLKIHLAPYHMLDVAAAMREILEARPLYLQKLSRILGFPQDYVMSIMVGGAAIHDIGKISDAFQGKSLEACAALGYQYEGREEYTGPGRPGHHSHAALALAQQEILPRISRRERRSYRQLLSAFFSHHGSPFLYDDNLRILVVGQYTEENKTAIYQYLSAIQTLFGIPQTIEVPETQKMRDASWIINGLTTLADWLGSNSEIFTYTQEPMPLGDYWESFAVPRARQAVEEANIRYAPWQGEATFHHLFPGYEPRPLQKWTNDVTLEDGPSLFFIEDVTGSGKTEAGLVLARRLIERGDADGIYFAMPTQTSSNKIFDRIVSSFCLQSFGDEQPTVMLAHGTNRNHKTYKEILTRSFGSGEDSLIGGTTSSFLSDSRKVVFFSQIGIGTIDQLSMSVLPTSHQSLRFLGLLGKVIIIDEIHCYDSYQQEILRRFLKLARDYGIPVILMSATLPREMRKSLIEAFGSSPQGMRDQYPLATAVNGQNIYDQTAFKAQYTKTIKTRTVTELEHVLTAIKDAADSGKSVCWFRNTVGQAIEAFDLLSGRMPDVMLAHARFTRADRTRNDEEALKKFGKKSSGHDRRGQVVVATQVFEQSLDLDFDFMVSDLAPIDVLIQRFGRLCRHNRDALTGEVRDDITDTREAVALVYSPPHTDTPSSDWYSKVLGPAHYVYRNPVYLWRTAQLIGKEWKLPEDSRHLMNFVYDPDAYVPEGLKAVEALAQAEDLGKEIKARELTLHLDKGYWGNGGSLWLGEAPTRLTRPSRIFYLAEREGPHLRPLGGARSWNDCAISLDLHKVEKPLLETKEDQQAYDTLREGPFMRNQTKWSDILILQKDCVSGAWSGRGVRGEKEVGIAYSYGQGLRVF